MATVSTSVLPAASVVVPLSVQVGDAAVEIMSEVVDQPACKALLERFGDAIPKVAALSERIFPGKVSVELALDPEDETHATFVFDVEAAGEYAQYRDRMFAWHDEVDRIVPDREGAFCLIVHPRP
jgi:hypothetical protein